MRAPALLGVAVCVPLCAAVPAEAARHEWQSYFQVRYTQSEDHGDYLSLRRLKLFGRGPLVGNWSYYLQFLYKMHNHSVTDDHLVVQEANLILPTRRGKLTVGQFKPPFGMERFTSDAKLAVIDRSQPTDRLIPDGSLGLSFARDRGAQWDSVFGRGLTFSMGVFDGNGANEPPKGSGPLAVGGAVVERGALPKGRLHAEAALSWRKDRDIDFQSQVPGAPAGYAHFSGQDLRHDLAVAYDAGRESFRAEYLACRYLSNRQGLKSIDASGYYVQWAHSLSKRWSAAVRYEVIDPDESVTNSKDCSLLTIGGVYHIRSDFHKIQFNWALKSDGARRTDNEALTMQYQRFF